MMALAPMGPGTLLGRLALRLTHSAPKGGSFLPVHAPIDWGVSLAEALCAKYEEAASSPTLRTVSLVGAPPPPAPADASCVYVSHLGPPHAWDRLCPNLTDLDLSRSLLTSWHALAWLAHHRPLTHLRVDHVRMEAPPKDLAMCPHLTHLVVGDTTRPWSDAVTLGRAMPALTTLHWHHQSLTHLDMTPEEAPSLAQVFPHVHTLSLEGNALSSWSHLVTLLVWMPALTKLLLHDNALTHIDAATPTTRIFAHLNEIHVHTLSMASLRHLESYIPGQWSLVLEPAKDHDEPPRWQCIAQLARLTRLNHTDIVPAERTEAERYYLLHARPGDPRYEALCAIHGAPATAPAPTPTLRAKLLEVLVVRHPTPPTLAEVPTLRETAVLCALLRTMPVRSVHKKLERQYKAAGMATELYAVLAAEPDSILLALDDEWRDLAWYGVETQDLLVLVG